MLVRPRRIELSSIAAIVKSLGSFVKDEPQFAPIIVHGSELERVTRAVNF